MEISSKVYYEITTGQVLLVTSELCGNVRGTDKIEDMTIHEELKDKNIDEVNYIELPYGELNAIFKNAKSYSVNLENNQLEVQYYTQEKIDLQQQEQEVIIDRTATINQYLQLNQNDEILSQIEDLIIQEEFSKLNI